MALPDYTSKIVNVGIQNGGIEQAIPEVIPQEDMENLLLFSENDEQILENYELVTGEPNSHQEKVIKQYLGEDYNTEKNKIYALKDLDEDQLSKLSTLISEPLLEYSAIMSEETENQIKAQFNAKYD